MFNLTYNLLAFKKLENKRQSKLKLRLNDWFWSSNICVIPNYKRDFAVVHYMKKTNLGGTVPLFPKTTTYFLGLQYIFLTDKIPKS